MPTRSTQLCVVFGILLLLSAKTIPFAQQTTESSAPTITVPQVITLNGVLRDRNGQPLTGVVGLGFALYKDQQGGAPLWVENQNVQLDEQGRYAVWLGSTHTRGLPTELFTSGEPRWLGVQVQIAGEEEQPRIAFVSVPYALKAADADTIGGKPLSAFVLADASTNGSSTNKTAARMSLAAKGGEADGMFAVTAGSADFLAKFINSTDLGNSGLYESAGRVGLGTTNPISKLNVATEGASDYITLSAYGANLYDKGFLVRSARGTSTAPSSVANGDILFNLYAQGQNGVDYGIAGGLAMSVDGTVSGGIVPGAIHFQTMNSSGVFSERMRVSSSGNVGIGTTNPAATLDVAGNMKVSGAIIGGSNTTVSGLLAAVGGGQNNTASGSLAFVGGGSTNIASGSGSVVGGGSGNSANGSNAVVGGGASNAANGTMSFVGSGSSNVAGGFAASIGAGSTNSASGSYSSIGAGFNNSASGTYAVVGGGLGNSASATKATIAGGGRSDDANSSTGNRVTDDFGTVGGGGNNQAGDNAGTTTDHTYATVAGGQSNTASGSYAAILGGFFNFATGFGSAIGGGASNYVSGNMAFVGAGSANYASGSATVIGGGSANTASAHYSTVGGGVGNTTSATYSTVGGGFGNVVSALKGTIGGGGRTDDGITSTGNRVTDDFGTVGGGGNNQAGDNAGVTSDKAYATVGGGQGNAATGAGATIAGGQGLSASGDYATISGGVSNGASGYAAAIGGGMINSASGTMAVVAGGSANTSSGAQSAILGGLLNFASGNYATVAGGNSNTASNTYSFAAGHRAKATHLGSFVWGDSSNADVTSTANDTFTARAAGGVTFYSNSSATTGVNLAAGSGSWSMLSDRNTKENFRSVDGQTLLKRLNALPIQTWKYKSQDRSIQHMGPMAQDFRSAFGLGEDETHISSVDADGVALATIQALYRMVLEKEAQIEEMAERLRQVEVEIKTIRSSSSGNEKNR